MIRFRSLFFALLLAVPTAVSTGAQTVRLEQIASGLPAPVSIAHTRDTRLFVVLQGGQIVIWDGTRILPTPFLDIRSLVSAGGERGLLGMAFHPLYSSNGFFYINYTDRNGDTVIARYTRSAANANLADPNSAKVLLQVDQPFSNHNGGQLDFGPDGFLYIGLGDGGSGNDPDNRAQNRADLLGKILRIDVDHGDPYAIPPGNPFLTTFISRAEVWAYGLRNPWRFSFDRVTGDLYIADVGQAQREEINFQPASSEGGENYGWRVMEGTLCYIPPSDNCNAGRQFVEPIIEYGRAGGACSVTGGYVYRGTRYPKLNGIYLYGDYCNGMIWGVRQTAPGEFRPALQLDTTLLISTFGEDIHGEVYVADHRNGGIYRIVDADQATKRRAIRH